MQLKPTPLPRLFFVVLGLWCIANPFFRLLAQTPTVTVGKVVRHENFTSQYLASRHIDVWLPPNYNPQQGYAVLYMQDGQMLFDASLTWNKQAWEVDSIAGALQPKILQPFIVVGMHNGGSLRRSEYMPQKPFESLSKLQQDSLLKTKRNGQLLFAAPVQADAYLRFVVQEVKPFIDRHYATLPTKEHTFIAGSSMGGLISLYALCQYPKIFGGAACLSTHWTGIFSTQNNPIPDALLAYLGKKLPKPRKKHKLYFDYGTVGLDSLYPPYQQKVDALLQSKGFTAKQWLTKECKGKDHTENAWKERFALPLLFLFGEKTKDKAK
jgi:enterochelin esterase-like enzyme